MAAIVYLTVTDVLLDTLAGVYVLPEILPPPLTTLHVPPAGVPVKAFVPVSQIPAVLVVLLAVPENGLTVKLRSLVVAGQEPLAAIVYCTVTDVLLDTLAGVYVLPEMLPPPLTMLHVPPPGVPARAFVLVSQIAAVLVVLLATSWLFTVKVRSLVDPGHEPLAAMVYLIVTDVLLDTLAGVYVLPEILPPPLTTLHVPPPGVPVNAFVLVSQIAAVLVVLFAVPEKSFTVKVRSLVVAGQAPLAGNV